MIARADIRGKLDNKPLLSELDSSLVSSLDGLKYLLSLLKGTNDFGGELDQELQNAAHEYADFFRKLNPQDQQEKIEQISAIRIDLQQEEKTKGQQKIISFLKDERQVVHQKVGDLAASCGVELMPGEFDRFSKEGMEIVFGKIFEKFTKQVGLIREGDELVKTVQDQLREVLALWKTIISSIEDGRSIDNFEELKSDFDLKVSEVSDIIAANTDYDFSIARNLIETLRSTVEFAEVTREKIMKLIGQKNELNQRVLDNRNSIRWQKVQSMSLDDRLKVVKNFASFFTEGEKAEQRRQQFLKTAGKEWDVFTQEVKRESFLLEVTKVDNLDNLERAWEALANADGADKWQEVLRALFDNTSYELDLAMTQDLENEIEASIRKQLTDAMLVSVNENWTSLVEKPGDEQSLAVAVRARESIRTAYGRFQNGEDWIPGALEVSLPEESRRGEFERVLINLHRQVVAIESGFEVDETAVRRAQQGKEKAESERDQLQLLNKVFVELSDWWEKPVEVQAKLDAIPEGEWQKIEQSGAVAINFLQKVQKFDILFGTLEKVTLEGLKESLGVREEFLAKQSEVQTEFSEFATVEKVGSLPVKFKRAFRKATAEDQWTELCGRTEWNDTYTNSSYQKDIQSWIKDMSDQKAYLERLSTAEENAQILQNRLKD